MEEGYDITTDSRYNYWLSLHPMSTSNSQMLSPVSEEQFSLVSPESSNHLPLICDETVKYTGRMEEGCDITTDSLYNYWLLSQPITSLPDKSSARIVTSEECRKQINEKHL